APAASAVIAISLRSPRRLGSAPSSAPSVPRAPRPGSGAAARTAAESWSRGRAGPRARWPATPPRPGGAASRRAAPRRPEPQVSAKALLALAVIAALGCRRARPDHRLASPPLAFESREGGFAVAFPCSKPPYEHRSDVGQRIHSFNCVPFEGAHFEVLYFDH